MTNGATQSVAETLITVVVCETATGTLRLVEDVICARILDGVHFDFDYTFIRPEAKPVLREIADDINRDPQRLLLLAGHTDRVGSDAYNQTLSESRARSVFGYTTNDVQAWVDLLNTELPLSGGPRVNRSGDSQSRDRWGIREIQYMLNYLRSASSAHFYTGPIDGINGAGTQAALDLFRAENGLPAGGGGGRRFAGVDEDTWRALFTAYIQVDALSVDLSRFVDPPFLGCGENFPRLETRAPGTESQDLSDADARLETNRRVEFLMIPPDRVPDPVNCENLYTNPESPVVICDLSPQPVVLTLHCSEGEDRSKHRANFALHVTGQGGFVREVVTDEDGKVVLEDADVVQGDYRVSAEGSFNLLLRDASQGQMVGAEVVLHVTRSVVIELRVVDVPARLDFTEFGNPDAVLDVLSDPITTSPVEFMLVAELDEVPDDLTTITVELASFLVRGPNSGVPGDPSGSSGIGAPATPLEFIDASDQVIQDVALNQRFRLRIDSGEIAGDEVLVRVTSQLVRPGR